MAENIPLRERRCVPCRGNVPPLSVTEVFRLVQELDGWKVVTQQSETKEFLTLQKELTFRDFRSLMDFLRRVENIAETEGHHPDFSVHYSRLHFILWTHAIGGLHENDFIMAAKIDFIYQVQRPG